MLAATRADTLRYEPIDKPADGATAPVVPGLHWLRMPLPFSLSHINLWLLEDGDGWTIVDTGIHSETTRGIWRGVLADAMGSRPVRRIVTTHLHPDHAGCAGWLARETGGTLCMTREEYLLCRLLVADTGEAMLDENARFYRAAGFPPEAMAHYRETFGIFGRLVARPPPSYHRLADGDTLTVGGRAWEVIVGRGHSPEHACLHCEQLGVLISGDQLLPEISSNVSLYPIEPEADPLAVWLHSLARLQARVPPDTLVLPAHGRPFRGAQDRAQALIDEHLASLRRLEALLRAPKRAVDVFEVLFRGPVNAANLVMATGEALAHLNYLVARGRAAVEADEDGVNWYRSP